ncbi:Tubulin-specific chaperone D [Yarrowia sp. C11]|nr:Tubulin-specific chaperone D [Yarrowia sp. E02]KAG5373366.1 Tubulin-specific chaperone D [Yarrowia sp. C11]
MDFTGSPEYDINTTEGDIGVTKSTSHLLATAQKHLDKNELIQFQTCIEPFQELPQLVDSKLQDFVTQLAEKYTEPNPNIARALYTLVNVRGGKIIARLMPNHVSRLIPVMSLVINQNVSWEEEFIVLLWLSTLARAPFPLDTIAETLPRDLVELAWKSLKTPGKSRDAAARLLGVLLTRDDMASYLSWFYSESSKTFSGDQDHEQFLQIGILQTLPHLIKFKTAEELKWYALDHQKLLYVVEEWANKSSSVEANTHRLLVKNISRLAQLQMSLATTEVPLEVEQSVGFFLSQLSHPNTLVRYTTSKAIARICQKLPEDLVAEVVDAVLAEIGKENISTADADKWHGVLLTLAEIIRRNLLPKNVIPRLYDILEISIPFEQRQLTYSVGSHVRDASCYVCWSLFRTVRGLTKDVQPVISLLVKVACFDRQVNNRRAASAAVQEFVGRQGPVVMETARGIDLLTKLDYFRLGSRENSYLSVSHDMQELGFSDLSDYLVEHCVTSWDPEIRRLGAESLGVLNQSHESKNHVVSLLSQLDISETDVRHGAMLALSELRIVTPEALELSQQLLNYVQHSHLKVGQEVFTAKAFVVLVGALWADSEDTSVWENLEKLTMCLEMNETDLLPAISASVSHLKLDSYSDIFSVWSQRLFETGYTSFAAALGALPSSPEIQDCLSYVIRASAPTHLADCATKAACIDALSRSGKFDTALIGSCLDNYTVDNLRGDVGKWVRQASLQTISKYSQLDWSQHVNQIVRISVETLDDLRKLAFSVLVELKLISGPRQSATKYFSQMLSLWDSFPESRTALVLGLTSLAGAERANTSLLGHSFDAIALFLVGSESRTSEFVSLMLTSIDKQNVKQALAGLRLVYKLFDLGIITPTMSATPDTGRPLVREIFVKTYNMHINTASYDRLQCCIRVFGSIAMFSDSQLRKQVVDRLVGLLGHPSTGARLVAAEVLSEVFSSIGLEDSAVDDLVLDTPWRNIDKVQLKTKMQQVKELLV